MLKYVNVSVKSSTFGFVVIGSSFFCIRNILAEMFCSRNVTFAGLNGTVEKQ
jgi:hypothetical protein